MTVVGAGLPQLRGRRGRRNLLRQKRCASQLERRRTVLERGETSTATVWCVRITGRPSKLSGPQQNLALARASSPSSPHSQTRTCSKAFQAVDELALHIKWRRYQAEVGFPGRRSKDSFTSKPQPAASRPICRPKHGRRCLHAGFRARLPALRRESLAL